MRKKIEWQLEKLDEGMYRAKVIGGWILLHCNHTTIMDGKKRDMVQSESMVFIPDRDHEWFIISPITETPIEKTKSMASDFEASN